MKRITIINGMTDDGHRAFEEEFQGVLNGCKDKMEVENFNIREMDIKYCCGCFGCWVKTPGKCVQNDEMPNILRSVIRSDLTVFVSPIRMGFVSSNIKKVCDKLIPLIHPYIEIVQGECHHKKRYKKYPKLGLVLFDIEHERKESQGIITDIYRRLALNFKTELAFSIMTDGSMEEVEHAINHI